MKSSARRSPRGFTLIEMLVAVAVAMIMMLAIAQIFALLGTNMDKGRALIEMSGQLRNVTHRLQEDLDGLTCSTLPWTKADAGDGYFEYIEGPNTDVTAGVTTMNGDIDDILAFTARSKGKPFAVSNGAGGVIESELAEIVWWRDTDGTLRRRIFAIRPDLSGTGVSTSPTTGTSNSLADLTLRHNRSLHAAGANALPNAMTVPLGTPAGNEVVLANVVAFDVKAWDPLAPVRGGATSALVPGDPGWVAATTTIGAGAYVDLGYTVANWSDPTSLGSQISLYSGRPNINSKLHNLSLATYSTWPFFYEQDGVNQDVVPGADQGTDGFDTVIDRVNNGTLLPPPDGTADPGQNAAADDPTEYETSPPYPHALTGFKAPGLRGIQVRIRMNEPDSRQVRQSTVVAEFLPE